jgi:hypothetical protein
MWFSLAFRSYSVTFSAPFRFEDVSQSSTNALTNFKSILKAPKVRNTIMAVNFYIAVLVLRVLYCTVQCMISIVRKWEDRHQERRRRTHTKTAFLFTVRSSRAGSACATTQIHVKRHFSEETTHPSFISLTLPSCLLLFRSFFCLRFCPVRQRSCVQTPSKQRWLLESTL